MGQPAFLKDGLVAYYPFNGDASDDSITANNGTAINVTPTQDRFGVAGKAFFFNGNDSYVQAPNRPLHQLPGDFCISFWAQAKDGGLNGTGNAYIIGCSSGPGANPKWLLTYGTTPYLNNPIGARNLFFQTQQYFLAATLTEKPESNWTSYTIVRKGNSYRQMVNGQVVASGNYQWTGSRLLSDINITGDLILPGIKAPLTIGWGEGSGFFRGKIDDVRIYNRALTDNEVKALYDYESTPPDNSFITNGLVAYYPFNGNANDESGSGNNGVLKGGAAFVNSSSLSQGVLSLDGASGYVDAQGPQISQYMTVSGWVNYNRLTSWGGLGLVTQGSDIEAAMNWHIGLNQDIPCRLRPHITIGGEWVNFNCATVLKSNQWYQVTMSYDGSFVKGYVNGVLDGSVAKSGEFKTTSGNLRIGSYAPVNGTASKSYFPGLLSDIRIYNRALSDTEIKALYDYESTPPDNSFITNGLVAYYPFNGNANDESGKGNDGQAYGPILAPDRFGNGNSAYNFSNNKGDKVLVSHNSSLNIVTDLTISSWVKVADLPQYRTAYTIVAKRELGGSQMPYLMGVNMQYGLPDDYNRFLFGSANGNYQNKESVQLPNQSWCQVATSISGSQIAFYLNGELVGVDTINPSLRAPNNGPLVIGSGQRTDIPAEFFNGLIDDVRIYNRAFSNAEVRALYSYESQPKPNNPSIAIATAQVVNGFVVGATITSGGNGYTNNPLVTITGGGGSGAKATAVQVNGVVTSISITNPGSGYTSAPSITIAPPPFPPKKATATSQVVNGFVVGVKITDFGFGYETAPTVLLVGGGGTGATATATVLNGVVTGITITNPGTGYTSAPLVRIASPPFTPKLAIEVSKVNVRLSVVLGRKYQIESSSDLANWKPASAVFVAQDEELIQEFDVNTVGSYYRINQVP